MKTEEKFRNKINSLKKLRPPPEIYPDIYRKHNICPICIEKTNEEDIKHPCDNKGMTIHQKCLNFIRCHWICHSCKEYFPNTTEYFRPVETGKMCKECFTSWRESTKKRVTE